MTAVVSVILPTYNEREGIAEIIAEMMTEAREILEEELAATSGRV